MENASMADAIKAAAKRLSCKEEEVVLKFKEDGMLWEIEGEDTYNSAIADGWNIHAEVDKGKQSRKRGRSSQDSEHSTDATTTPAPSKRVAQSRPSQPTNTVPPGPPSNHGKNAQPRSQSSRPNHGHPAMPQSRSKTLPLSTQDQMRSSGRAWSDKDKSLLWIKLIGQLRSNPPSGPTYTLEERREIFNRILRNNAKRFDGRTAVVLEGRIQKRVADARKAGQKLPELVELLFPHSRVTVTKSKTTPQPKTNSQPNKNRGRSDRQISNVASAIQKRTSVDLAWVQSRANGERASVPSTSTASAKHARRRYENDAIRVEALDIPGPSRRRSGLDSLSVIDEPDNDSNTHEEDGENGMSDGPSTFETDVDDGPIPSSSRTNSRDPGENVAAVNPQRDFGSGNSRVGAQSPSTHGTISNDSLFVPSSISSLAYEPTSGSSIKEEYEISPLTPPETPRDNLLEVRGDAETSRSTSLAPSVKVEDVDVSRVSDMPPSVVASIRADDVRKEITSALDRILPNISPDSHIKSWADKLHRKLSISCFVADASDDTRFNASESAYCLSAALDELFRYAYVRSQSVHERRLFIVAIAMLFEALHSKMYFLTGFEVLLCKFFHQILFDGPPNSMRFSAQLIACCSILIHPYVYDSILDGVFIQPWTKKSNPAQPKTKLSPSETEQIFVRMGELIEGLNVATVAVQQRSGSRALAERRTKPIRFGFRSWKRVFEETQCDSNISWRTPTLLQDVRQGMEKWNKLPIAITTKIVNQDEGRSSASTSRENINMSKKPVHSSTTTSTQNTGQQRSLHTSPASNTRSNQQSQLFLGLPDFSQSFSYH
ncbi:hypothetical protein L7F22_009648 [Adiantum nelumboides]|nr:hypothetical protein [Adiantum nelumboides]